MIEALQLIVIGVINGSMYALLAVGFGMILQVTGRFHIAYSVTYAVAGLAAAVTTSNWGVPFAAALVIGMAVATLLGVLIENYVYWPLGPRAGNFVLLAIFTASLGMLTVGQGIIGLLLIDAGTLQIGGFEIEPLNIGDIYGTNLDVVSVVLAWVLIGAVAVVMARTKLGRMVRAVRSNLTMSVAVGISPRMIFLVVFGIGSALGAVAAVLITTKSALATDSGQSSILYALTIAFLAGMRASPIRVATVALGIGIIESLCNLWISPVWDPVIIYGLLLVYAALKPFDLGARFRRVPRPAEAV